MKIISAILTLITFSTAFLFNSFTEYNLEDKKLYHLEYQIPVVYEGRRPSGISEFPLICII